MVNEAGEARGLSGPPLATGDEDPGVEIETLWMSAAEEGRWADLEMLADTRFFRDLLVNQPAVERALQLMPDERLHAHPRYLVARDLAHARGRSLAMLTGISTQAYVRWVGAQQRPATRDVIAVLCAHIQDLNVLGRFAESAALVDEICVKVDEADDRDGFPDILPEVFILGGLSKLLAGHRHEAAALFEEGYRWSRDWGWHPAGVHLGNMIALAHALCHDYVRAADAIADWAGTRPHEPGVLADVYASVGILARGLIAVGAVDLDGLDAVIAAVDEPIRQSSLWWIAVHLVAQRALLSGNARDGARELERTLTGHRSLSRPAAYAGEQLRADLADLYEASGDLAAAQDVLNTPGLSVHCGPMVDPLVRLEILRGDQPRAERHLDEALQRRGPRAPTYPSWEVLQLAISHMSVAAEPPADQTEIAQLECLVRRTGAVNALVNAPSGLREALSGRLGLPRVSTEVFPVPRVVQLTRREREVLEALHRYANAGDIAAALHISRNTAKTHMASVYRKLGVHTRQQALKFAAKL
ncbi:helix-turn-helix transcriptional regulator [Clavibacter sp. VKM Ac-2873]|uniref:helix-turn-helix transcriptional regulator n=1 Tax=Clavibacter sp. VKM Ac-2873 TaxID=2783813 RepID=UPI00188A4F9D|nr:helix-turn-helix transcriptional regulator [Clavibacter sp. VKM Ac-2873]MBF4619520.1 helix-turn-helix transcriptional regulator [Clavibacter sp. VKM Ac-2873]